MHLQRGYCQNPLYHNDIDNIPKAMMYTTYRGSQDGSGNLAMVGVFYSEPSAAQVDDRRYLVPPFQIWYRLSFPSTFTTTSTNQRTDTRTHQIVLI